MAIFIAIFVAFAASRSQAQVVGESGDQNPLDSSAVASVARKPTMRLFDFMDQSLVLLFKFHQLFLSDIDGPNCPMQPTCSNFGIQSVEQRGFLLGTLKTMDRLNRCSHDLKFYDYISRGERGAYEDPP